MLILVLVLGIGSMVSTSASEGAASTSEEVTASARQAFRRLSVVYASGSTATELVAKLNGALELIQEASYKRLKGDEASALTLKEQARMLVEEVTSEIPAAQRRAQNESMIRTVVVILSIPVVVAISALVFFSSLRAWRWYEKIRFFEMRIIEKKKEVD
jgi:hypothetical protein